ncbi:M20 family metallopeptidase [Bacillus sp. 1NLA3E]|uniref:M20 family metallopeptidase n=1 Tax=Bacillus sp. 1NLA3E TaxID=666686 RepID=UPI000247E876|nr:M20 family metallopeptidase [Bacillus sp. 1NLA3E]AGK55867.1 peptidase M20 family protein [Bacillus sp. 1NLA3E]
MQNWSKYFQDNIDGILTELKTYVEMESPSSNKQAVDKLGSYIQQQFEKLGCRFTRNQQKEYGDQLRLEYGEGAEQILILGHFDTVKDIGTLEVEPWRIEEGKVYGPGTYDMKAGIIFAYFALKAIKQFNLPLNKRIVFIWNTDEEMGSPSSRVYIQEEAAKSCAVLVLEPAFGNGSLKTSRKGGAEFKVTVHGRAVHAGNDHAKGVNAIAELAQHILAIQSWTDYQEGTTLSVGMIKGGSAVNVVPEFAEAIVDVRVAKKSAMPGVQNRSAALKPVHPEAKVSVEWEFITPPMERTEQTERLFRLAAEQAKLEGFELTEVTAGGTSDGNFAAATGVPVLDGLGPVGDGAHASNEHITLKDIPERIALLVRILTAL